MTVELLSVRLVISIERGTLDVPAVIGDRDDVVIASVTAMELLMGVERASEARRSQRAVHVEAVLNLIPIQDYTLEVARVHAKLAVQAQRRGRPRGSFDLIIAATAAATERVLLTTDGAAEFNVLSGVTAELIQ